MLVRDQMPGLKCVRFYRDNHHMLHMASEGGGSHRVQVKRAFPLTDPDRYITVATEEGFVGFIRHLRQLDSASLEVVEEELEHNYFLPKITGIKRISEENRVMQWMVETDRGPREFEVASRKSDIQWVSDFHVVIRDVDGNRYEIPNLAELDEASRDKLEMEV